MKLFSRKIKIMEVLTFLFSVLNIEIIEFQSILAKIHFLMIVIQLEHVVQLGSKHIPVNAYKAMWTVHRILETSQAVFAFLRNLSVWMQVRMIAIRLLFVVKQKMTKSIHVVVGMVTSINHRIKLIDRDEFVSNKFVLHFFS